jgi:hypothetical protein
MGGFGMTAIAQGIFRGIVTNNVDPEGYSRVKALVPQVFGNETSETGWAWPVVPPGWASALVKPHRTITYYTGGGAGTPGTVQDTPHALSIVAQSGEATPVPGQGVWIAFEGGDIEFPLWLGVWK